MLCARLRRGILRYCPASRLRMLASPGQQGWAEPCLASSRWAATTPSRFRCCAPSTARTAPFPSSTLTATWTHVRCVVVDVVDADDGDVAIGAKLPSETLTLPREAQGLWRLAQRAGRHQPRHVLLPRCRRGPPPKRHQHPRGNQNHAQRPQRLRQRRLLRL